MAAIPFLTCPYENRLGATHGIGGASPQEIFEDIKYVDRVLLRECTSRSDAKSKNHHLGLA
jgi:hypothetical protein